MMHAIIEPSVLIWDKDEFEQAILNDSLKKKYEKLIQDLVYLIKQLQEERPDYLKHKVYLRPELSILLYSQFPFNDTVDIFENSPFDLIASLTEFLMKTDFEDYDCTYILADSFPDFCLDYYGQDAKTEVCYLYNFIFSKMEDVTLFGLSDSAFQKHLGSEGIIIKNSNAFKTITHLKSETEVDVFFNNAFGNKNYQGIVKTGLLYLCGTNSIEKYFFRLKRKYELSPKHSPKYLPARGYGWGTHIFAEDAEASEALQEAIWNEDALNSHFLYALIQIYGKNIIHEFPITNITDNSYHGYPVCDEKTYLFLQDEYRKINPDYPKNANWQSGELPSFIRKRLIP